MWARSLINITFCIMIPKQACGYTVNRSDNFFCLYFCSWTWKSFVKPCQELNITHLPATHLLSIQDDASYLKISQPGLRTDPVESVLYVTDPACVVKTVRLQAISDYCNIRGWIGAAFWDEVVFLVGYRDDHMVMSEKLLGINFAACSKHILKDEKFQSNRATIMSPYLRVRETWNHCKRVVVS